MMFLMKLLARWVGAYARAISSNGVWVYAPPLVLTASNPIWRAAPPARIEETVVVEPARPSLTDPQLVAARRACFRLILNESKA